MMTRTLLARCAPLAIAASVAFPYPSAAQDAATAEPVIVLPEPAPVVAPEPIVLSEAAADPPPVMATPPKSAPAPHAATSARTQNRETRAARSAAATGPAPAPLVKVAAAPAAVTGVAAPATTEAAPLPSELVARSANDSAIDEMTLAALLGALGLGVVGGVAYAASRRRRRQAVENEALDPLDNAAIPAAPSAEPVIARSSEPVAAPVHTASAPVTAAFAAPVVRAASLARTAPHSSGDPVALPNAVPENFDERDALLKKLIAAAPDKANPFTSPRARARRAKLIIQSLARDFTSRKPRIDLSEYTNRWPALRGWQPATA